MKNDVSHHLEFYLERCLPRHSFSDIYRYAVLPAGKLFRPKMAIAAFADAGGDLENIPLEHNIWPFACALEIHHAYTLIHDDLPAMDDDDERRGKPATHKAYGEWQAILAGDGLNIASFGLLSKVSHPQLPFLLKLMAHALGPKGLIHGQALDLSHEMNKSFASLLLTHELKTARLIQLALVGGSVLARNEFNTKTYEKMWRLGYAIGVTFQLLDDLLELNQDQLSTHETDINPWPTRTKECAHKTVELLNKIEQNCGHNVRLELREYFKKTQKRLDENKAFVKKHIKEHELLLPVMTLLKRLSE